MQDFLPVDRKESREDTFGKTGSLPVSLGRDGRVSSAYKNQYLYVSSWNLRHKQLVLTSYSSSIVVVVYVVVVRDRDRDTPIDVSRGGNDAHRLSAIDTCLWHLRTVGGGVTI